MPLETYNYTVGSEVIVVNPTTFLTNGITCGLQIIFPNGYFIIDPILPLFSFIALMIGINCGNRIRSTNANASLSYSLSFYAYGCMMTIAMLADTFFVAFATSNNSFHVLLELILLWLDVALTSSIALSFGFNALVDAGWINEQSRQPWKVMATVYLSVFGLWFTCIFYEIMWLTWYLYQGIILVSCGMYLAGEFAYIVLKGNTQGIVWLALAGIAGGVGFLGASNFPDTLCNIITPYFGAAGWWFAWSDVSVFLIYVYFMNTKSQRIAPIITEKNKVNKDVDIEMKPFISNP